MKSYFKKITVLFAKEKVALLFFLLYFLIGISVLRDYGVSWDEFYMEGLGQVNLDYIQGKNQVLLSQENSRDQFNAPFHEITITATRRIVAKFDKNFADMGRDFTLYRHFLNFLTFFTGVVFFYLICRRRFKSSNLALLGAIFLILTPRLFSDAFYNSKDTVFMAYFIITFYALVKYLEKRSIIRLSLLAVLTGITFSIRVGVSFIPFFTIFCFVADYFFRKTFRENILKDLAQLLFYASLTAYVIFVTYPILWSSPIRNFFTLMELYAHQPNNVPNLYMGTYVGAYHVPWHYIPVWMSITTPPLYIALFLIGLIGLLIGLRKDIKNFYLSRRDDILFLFWFFFPLTTVIILHSVVYNSWRHLFFIFPAFLIIALHGVVFLKNIVERHLKSRHALILLSILLIANLVYIEKEMADLHPYEHLYFNFLAGSDMKSIRKNFETDYWGLTLRKGLEFLLSYDKSKQIVAIADYPGWSNQFILSEKDRQRLYVGFPWDKGGPKPKYYLTNFYFTQKEPPYKELYALKVKGASLLKVYELPESDDISFDGKFPYR